MTQAPGNLARGEHGRPSATSAIKDILSRDVLVFVAGMWVGAIFTTILAVNA
jgi:hypothetical protein